MQFVHIMLTAASRAENSAQVVLLTGVQGSLTKGDGSVQLTSLYQLALFILRIFIFYTKQFTLMRRSIVLSHPSPTVSIPWFVPALTNPDDVAYSNKKNLAAFKKKFLSLFQENFKIGK